MTQPIRVNEAARRNLERVVLDEQDRAAVLLARVRAGGSALLLVLLLITTGNRSIYLGPTLWGALGYTLISALVLASTAWVRTGRRWFSLAVPFLDVPAVAALQVFQAMKIGTDQGGLPNAVAFPMAFVALSILSLSPRVIALTSVSAIVVLTLRLSSIGFEPPVIAIVTTLTASVAVVGATVVNRLRGLVIAARQRDLLGKYILGERLGAGGMAEVFKATYSPEGGFERTVAIKRILPAFLERPEAISLFRQEAALSARLHHPNVVQVLDFATDGEGWFIALEFIDGVPLSKILRQAATPLPIPLVVYVVDQLARALDYIHTRPNGSSPGLIHRDVNPPNVLVSVQGEVKLGDFGVARAIGSSRATETGVLRGKLEYAAPEQLRSQPLDARVDLWALGITVFELLTSTRPFRGDDDAALYRACLEAEVPSVAELRPDVPVELGNLVKGLLTRDVGARIASARDVLSALDPLRGPERDAQRLLTELVSKARGPSSSERPTTYARS